MNEFYKPAQQEWVCCLPIMQQSVLFAAVRGPDGIRKNHPVKAILRWYRRCILLSAFDGKALNDPFEPGGGDFTGPFDERQLVHYFHDAPHPASLKAKGLVKKVWAKVQEKYLAHVDELPHHFQLHLMHAAQIVGCHHPDDNIRLWWKTFYLKIVNDAHLHPESDEEMNRRLGDNPDDWKARMRLPK